MKHEPYSSRRQTLLDTIGDGVAIIPTAPERIRNRDSHHPYRFDSYFWYLTGFPEPEAVAVLVGGEEPRSILFCREKNEEREVWDGFRHGPAAALDAFGFDEAFPIFELEQRLPDLLANRDTVWHALGHDSAWDAKIVAALNTVRAQTRAGKRAPAQLRDLREPLDRMRLIKDAHELQIMRRAANITAAGHVRAMRASRP
ncbi:aminopeptidase P N-terminal domain-containing protein, partial [Propionivibrio sp.]|uniref:aminopeptidase P N-terminal domain-containing protein n=1 Tax=Propionivibrio sp. TaxID=2212460 RepID=UPI00272DF96F